MKSKKDLIKSIKEILYYFLFIFIYCNYNFEKSSKLKGAMALPSSNINAIEQHANTLRIGILSYTEFIQSNDPLLEQVIDEFRDSKYWLIWLTIFEAIAKKDEDTSVINQNPKIVRFYKEITLEKSWAKVIDFINNDKNIYIKELLNRFL